MSRNLHNTNISSVNLANINYRNQRGQHGSTGFSIDEGNLINPGEFDKLGNIFYLLIGYFRVISFVK